MIRRWKIDIDTRLRQRRRHWLICYACDTDARHTGDWTTHWSFVCDSVEAARRRGWKDNDWGGRLSWR